MLLAMIGQAAKSFTPLLGLSNYPFSLSLWPDLCRGLENLQQQKVLETEWHQYSCWVMGDTWRWRRRDISDGEIAHQPVLLQDFLLLEITHSWIVSSGPNHRKATTSRRIMPSKHIHKPGSRQIFPEKNTAFPLLSSTSSQQFLSYLAGEMNHEEVIFWANW